MHANLPSRPSRSSGFTLVEAMVVITITAILLALAAPSFVDIFRRFRVDNAREELIASINLARAEAIRTGQTVSIRRTDGCGDGLGSGQDWSCGWQVFLDRNPDGKIGTIDSSADPAADETVFQSVSIPQNTRAQHHDAGDFISFNKFGQVTQLGQRFSFYASDQTVAIGKSVCFTTGTRIRTAINAPTCPN